MCSVLRLPEGLRGLRIAGSFRCLRLPTLLIAAASIGLMLPVVGVQSSSGGSSGFSDEDWVSGTTATDDPSTWTNTTLTTITSGGSLDTFTFDPSSVTSGSGPSSGSSSTNPPHASPFDTPSLVPIIRIEEDWEMCVGEPDDAEAAPQAGTVMSPLGDASNFYLTFSVNHRFSPSFSPGGLELQVWHLGNQMGFVNVGETVLAVAGETITWTQQVEIRNAHLGFRVINGQSSSWGSFGQGNSLRLRMHTLLADLNLYHPHVSVLNSGVTFAAHKVGSLTLKAVRGYDIDGNLVVEDAVPYVVHSY